MTNYVLLTVVPSMYICERCEKLIEKRQAIGMRDEKGNHYFHVEECVAGEAAIKATI